MKVLGLLIGIIGLYINFLGDTIFYKITSSIVFVVGFSILMLANLKSKK